MELAQLKNLTQLNLRGNELTGSIPVELAQLEYLTVLYEATGGANWKANTNWLSAAPLDEWYGVTTDEEGRVLRLNLDQNELTGSIPVELAQLEYLTVLAA